MKQPCKLALDEEKFIKGILQILPASLKRKFYASITRMGARWGLRIHPSVWRLPFGLLLKMSRSNSDEGVPDVEGAALQFLDTSIRGVNFPRLVDRVQGTAGRSFILSTYVSGIDGCDAVDLFSEDDWARLEGDLHDQLKSLQRQTCSSNHKICNAAGGIIDDPRIVRVAEQNIDITSTENFWRQVWSGLDFPRNRDTIRPRIEPLMQRAVPIVFCHGDLFLRNFIFPGGLDEWRAGRSRICLVDWEFAGWMPAPWDALKSTFVECESSDSPWIQTVKRILPNYDEYLDADWLWRSKSGVTMV
ncbi:protein kinase subdomain-containing protein PKL [Ephemerocybe angulata]|uniref:Protein kinase subdomain-containing protein PKL n=1 Tax=Ephemerocybe angulata TaxID=980116 RepID=A0A8H6IBR9_9AGAR|nr:protein kinase subdomain-containing protein PKL [Tulosesus angulatus]